MAVITPLLLLLKNAKRSAITPGLVSSILLSVSFVALRKLKPFCKYLPTENRNGCTFDWVSRQTSLRLVNNLVGFTELILVFFSKC